MNQVDNIEIKTNPLLNYEKLPGETFTLPSGGLFYTNGELDGSVKNGEVYVQPMSALDEITIKSPDLLYSGKAIEEVFSRCIPKIIKPMELLAKDVDFLMICLRKVSFGSDMIVSYTHDCKNAEDHTYVVSMDDFIKSSKRIDPTTVASTYSLTVNKSQHVKLHPLQYKEFVAVSQMNEQEFDTPEKVKELLFNALSNVIVSVNDVTDKDMILEWLNDLPATVIKEIKNKMGSATDWGPSFTSTVVCKDCKKSIQVTAPLNPIAFFT